MSAAKQQCLDLLYSGLKGKVTRESLLVKTSWGLDLNFPPGFKFGASTASYQIEGAWNVSDKSESIWDRFLHTNPYMTADGGNGDVACDSYHKWREDIQHAAEMGLKMYRFSLSWTRIMPNGFANYISEEGSQHYNNMIDEMLKYGIEPLVTIYHWDLPQSLQDLGGWTNPLITDWFADYARVVYSLYGDRVKLWLTINEPLVMCDMAYMMGVIAPGIVDPDVSPYMCNKNVLIAHAKAWRIYDEEFKPKHHGQVSLTNNLLWFEAASPEDEDLAELVMEYCTGRFSHAIFSKEGGWPPSIEKLIEDNSRREGYTRTRLPPFSEEEKDLVRGTYDFYGVNYYTSRLIRRAKPGEDVGPWFLAGAPELGAVLEFPTTWEIGASNMLPAYPVGMRRHISWLNEHYGEMMYIITENGYADLDDGINDNDRIKFMRDHLEQVLLSIQEDRMNITGYVVWSLIDDFEWLDGYRIKFGLYDVDFNDPARRRRPKKSSRYYASIIKDNSLDVPLEPRDWWKVPSHNAIPLD